MSGLMGRSASSSPQSPSLEAHAADDPRTLRDGEAGPTRRLLADGRTELVDPHAFRPYMSPELRAAFMAAEFAWARTKAPWLLGEWLA